MSLVEPERLEEPMTGWRTWRLRRRAEGSFLLTPMFQPEVWQPQVAVSATCRTHRTHRAPVALCSCGLYAFSHAEELGPLPDKATVVGTVSMWGRVVEHERGFRSQYAYPSRLRLVCRPCIRDERGDTRCDTVLRPAGSHEWIALCEMHAKRGVTFDEPMPAAQVQAQLLSTYAVDLLPEELVARIPADTHDSPLWPWLLTPGVRGTGGLVGAIIRMLAGRAGGAAPPKP